MARRTLAVWVLAFSALAYGADDPPAWLQEAATRQAPDYEGDVGAVVLLDEETVSVDVSGKITTTRRGAIRVLQQSGRERAEEAIWYTTDTDRVRKLEGWVIFSSGGHTTLDKKDIVERAPYSGNLYDESRIQVLSGASVAEPGAVFGFESVLEEKSIFAQFQYGFQGDLPTLTARYNLQLPAGWTAKSTTFNAPNVEPLVQGSRYTWELRNLAPIRLEAASPSFSGLAPRLAVTYFPPTERSGEMSFAGWSEVATWLDQLSAPQVEPDASVRGQAERLTAGLDDPWERLRKIGEFVQGVTYVSIQMGTGSGGGYTPHAAPEVLRNLYGDCKDKANLMRSLLQAVGIRSHLVVIHSSDPRYVREEWPSPYQFNHAIIAIEVGEDVTAAAVGEWPNLGRLLLFDPTDPYTPFGQLPESEQGSWALVTAPENGLLVRVPWVEPEHNRIEREATVRLSPAGGVEVTLKETSIGQSATTNRARYRRASGSEYRSGVERWIARGAPAAKVESLEIDDDSNEAFGLALTFSSPAYAQSIAGRLLVFKPAIVLQQNATYLTDEVRQHPAILSANAFRETVRFILPEGFEVDERPPDIELHTEFGDYSATWTATPDALVFTRQLTVKNAEVAPEDYSGARDFFRAVAGSEQAPVVLAKL